MPRGLNLHGATRTALEARHEHLARAHLSDIWIGPPRLAVVPPAQESKEAHVAPRGEGARPHAYAARLDAQTFREGGRAACWSEEDLVVVATLRARAVATVVRHLKRVVPATWHTKGGGMRRACHVAKGEVGRREHTRRLARAGAARRGSGRSRPGRRGGNSSRRAPGKRSRTCHVAPWGQSGGEEGMPRVATGGGDGGWREVFGGRGVTRHAARRRWRRARRHR